MSVYQQKVERLDARVLKIDVLVYCALHQELTTRVSRTHDYQRAKCEDHSRVVQLRYHSTVSYLKISITSRLDLTAMSFVWVHTLFCSFLLSR